MNYFYTDNTQNDTNAITIYVIENVTVIFTIIQIKPANPPNLKNTFEII